MYSFSWYSLGLALFSYVEHRVGEEIDKRVLDGLKFIEEQGAEVWDRVVGAALDVGFHAAVKHYIFLSGPDSKYAGKPPQDVLRDSIQPGAKKD